MEYGVNGTKSGLTVLKLLSMTLFGDRICPVDKCDYFVPENTPLCAHFIQNHVINLPAGSTPDFFVDLIVSTVDDPDRFHELTRLGSSIYRKTFPFLSLIFLFIAMLLFYA